MGQTTTWALPYPEQTDPADVPVDMQELCARLETVLSQLKSGGAIPGEVRMWSGSTLPVQATFGHWVWADGTAYSAATYPQANTHIATAWKTHGGKADPGAGMFRVPDLRGQTPIGMDAMPGGARANRITRAAAATLAAVSGEEYHTLALAESPVHNHGVSDPTHAHSISDPGHLHGGYQNPGFYDPGAYAGAGSAQQDYRDAPGWSIGNPGIAIDSRGTGIGIYGNYTGISIGNAGSGGAHENVPPTTFVPWICKLDD